MPAKNINRTISSFLSLFLCFVSTLTVIDHSGFRIHYTRHLRKEDGGMMISGVSVSDTQIIPPQQKLYRNVGICGPSCTSVVSTYTDNNKIA